MAGQLAQTGKLVRLAWRRDRWRLALWVGGIAALTLVVARAYPALVPTPQDRQAMAVTMANPAVTAMFGPAYSLEDYHFGAIMGHQMLLFTALVVAVMNILLAARYSRAEEETGRSELVRALPVGRLANLGGPALLLVAVNLLLALVIGGGLAALQIEAIDVAGSLLYGAALGASGFWFAAATLLIAQLVPSSRMAVGYAVALLVACYLVRAIGDVTETGWSWLSPLGWIVRTEVYVTNTWLPVGLALIGSLVLVVAAAYLSAIRDLGAGLVPERPGRLGAAPSLAHPLGLVWRLERSAVLGWAAGMVILGASYGSVFGDLEGYLEAIELLRLVLTEAAGVSLTEQFLPMLMVVLGITAGIPTLLVMHRLRGEEYRQRLEHLVTKGVSRQRLMATFLVLSWACGLAMPLLAALGMWAAAAATMAEPVAPLTMVGAALVHVPALWVMAGLAACLIGAWPAQASLSWWYLGYGFIAMYLGTLLQLPAIFARLTPFGHVPRYPVEAIHPLPLLVLTVIALLLALFGVAGYRQRDLLQ